MRIWSSRRSVFHGSQNETQHQQRTDTLTILTGMTGLLCLCELIALPLFRLLFREKDGRFVLVGFSAPELRLQRALRHTLAVGVHEGEASLAQIVALVRGSFCKRECLRIVWRYTQPFIEEHREHAFGCGIAPRGAHAQPA